MIPALVERRRAKRYRLQTELQYLALDGRNQPKVGEGRSSNMSSTGLLFRPDAPLPHDWRCCAAVLKWPAGRTQTEPAPLMILFGYPVRIGSSEIALSVSHHVFLRMEAVPASIEALLLRIGSEKSAFNAFKKHLKAFRPSLHLVKRNS